MLINLLHNFNGAHLLTLIIADDHCFHVSAINVIEGDLHAGFFHSLDLFQEGDCFEALLFQLQNQILVIHRLLHDLSLF